MTDQPARRFTVRLPAWVRRARRSRRVWIGAGVLSALVVVITLGPQIWVWRHRGAVHSVQDVAPAPVALVLGAGVYSDGQPSPFLHDRLEIASQLYVTGEVKALLVSGDNRTSHYDEPTAMRRWLVEHGVPDNRIVTDFAGRDTYDSCARAQRIFGAQRLIVVTQSYHVPRAVAICDALGLDAQGVGTDRGAQYAPDIYQAGAWREYPANIKAAWDVLSGRDPILGNPEPGLRQIVGE